MKIQIKSDSRAIAVTDRIQLHQRANHWLRRVKEMIRMVSVKISAACTNLLADDSFCLIEAHLANGIRLSAHARGNAPLVAIDRALRRLARAIASQMKREALLAL